MKSYPDIFRSHRLWAITLALGLACDLHSATFDTIKASLDEHIYNLPDQKLTLSGEVTIEVIGAATRKNIYWREANIPILLERGMKVPEYSVEVKNVALISTTVVNPDEYYKVDIGRSSFLAKIGTTLQFTPEGFLAGAKSETTDQAIPLFQGLMKLALAVVSGGLLSIDPDRPLPPADSDPHALFIEAETRAAAAEILAELKQAVELFDQRATDRQKLVSLYRDILEIEGTAPTPDQLKTLELKKLQRDLLIERIAFHTLRLAKTKQLKHEFAAGLLKLTEEQRKSRRIVIGLPAVTLTKNPLPICTLSVSLSGNRLGPMQRIRHGKPEAVPSPADDDANVIRYRVPFRGEATVTLARKKSNGGDKDETTVLATALPVTVTQLGDTRWIDPRASFAENKTLNLEFYTDTAAIKLVSNTSSSSLPGGIVDLAQQYTAFREKQEAGKTEQAALDAENKLLKARLDNISLKEQWDAKQSALGLPPENE